MDGIHIPHHGKDHIGRGVKRLVAVVERLGGNMGNTLHRTGNAGAGSVVLIQRSEHPGVDLPVGVVLDHADLLTDDPLLLGNALIREIRNGHEGQQDPQILLEMLGRVKVIGRHGVGGKGIRLRAVLRQFL